MPSVREACRDAIISRAAVRGYRGHLSGGYHVRTPCSAEDTGAVTLAPWCWWLGQRTPRSYARRCRPSTPL